MTGGTLSITAGTRSGHARARVLLVGVLVAASAVLTDGARSQVAAPCAYVAGICVAVDTAATSGPISHVGSGFNLGFTGATPQSIVTPLQPKNWRISPGDVWAFNWVKQVGSTVTVVLSNTWAINNWNSSTGRVLRNPWVDWAIYRQFVIDMVSWHVNNGMVPEQFEIQNEPDVSYYSVTTAPPTRALILEQFRVAHDAIRSVLPTAKIVGPSLGAFEVDNTNRLLDIKSFLDFAVAKSLKFDVLAWHELGMHQFGDADADPGAIVTHVQTARQMVAARPSLGQVQISINEFGAKWYQIEPGATARYFAALEQAKVDTANLACYPMSVKKWIWTTWYDSCTSGPGLLDGLRLPPYGATASDYWTYAAYASMTGTRVTTTSTNPWTSALATVAPDGSLSVLIGRGHGCNRLVQQYCYVGQDAIAAATLVVPFATGMASAYQTTVQRIPNMAGGVGGPATVSVSTISATNGVFTIPINAGLADGDAIVVRMVRAA